MIKYISFLFVFFLMGCSQSASFDTEAFLSEDPTQFVNPFIGTSKMGHVFPGATVPFGMVQLSPQTHFEPMFDDQGAYNPETYAYCAGYQYKDSTLLGFAHTNFSGTGHSDLGDFLLMPTHGELILDPLDSPEGKKGFCSSFSHDEERAEPGFYSVHLKRYGIDAALTTSPRVGFHKYTFPETREAHILLDLVYNVYHHENKNVWTFIRVENDSTVTGYRQTKGWARTKKVFFTLQFSKPFKKYGHKKYDQVLYDGFYRRFDQEENFPEMAGKDIRVYFDFDMERGEELMVKFALSPVSTAGAMANMESEIPHWDFDQVRREAKQKWREELQKVQIEALSEDEKIIFYTALYHASLTPILYQDVDGKYRGLDQNIHKAKGFTHYSIFSLWDTYRALHPLFNLLQPSRNNDMIKSMLAHYDQSVHGMLPIWSHYANENWCMIGYHATSVIADAAVKGVGDFDKIKALKACHSTANVSYFDGLGDYLKYQYVPDDLSHSSVSKTLELAYDDWCVSQLAKSVGNSSLEKLYVKRALNYQNVYDASIGYMRPRLSSGAFRERFDPLDTHGQGFIEGNAWNYGLYVPQDPAKMIDMMGGARRFESHLDSLFTMELDDVYIEKNEDITRDGIMGNYVHGNEPGHHIPYLYNWTGTPHKTQSIVRKICSEMYGPGVDGLCGNDDAGQMSAWYIFSSLGFYPLCPGSPFYELGSPNIQKARIRLESGRDLWIRAENQSDQNVYVQAVYFNDKKIEGNKIEHQILMQGGELRFVMGASPIELN